MRRIIEVKVKVNGCSGIRLAATCKCTIKDKVMIGDPCNVVEKAI